MQMIQTVEISLRNSTKRNLKDLVTQLAQCWPLLYGRLIWKFSLKNYGRRFWITRIVIFGDKRKTSHYHWFWVSSIRDILYANKFAQSGGWSWCVHSKRNHFVGNLLKNLPERINLRKPL